MVASEDKMQEVNLATGWPRLFSCGVILPKFQKVRKVFRTNILHWLCSMAVSKCVILRVGIRKLELAHPSGVNKMCVLSGCKNGTSSTFIRCYRTHDTETVDKRGTNEHV